MSITTITITSSDYVGKQFIFNVQIKQISPKIGLLLNYYLMQFVPRAIAYKTKILKLNSFVQKNHAQTIS